MVALASYRVQNRRYFAAADATGKVVLFVDSGERVYAVLDTLDGPVVAFKPSTRRINWLTANGAGGVDPSTFEVRWAACAHLNGTTLASAAFDVIASSKFYAVSGDGEVITGFANPDAGRASRARRETDARFDYPRGRPSPPSKGTRSPRRGTTWRCLT